MDRFACTTRHSATRHVSRLPLWLVLVAHAAFAADFSGKPVADVLAQLRGQGLTFIYNNEIVPDDLRVSTEPRAESGVELAREILEPHGLTLTQVAPQTFAVVRMQPSRTQTRPAARIDSRAPLEEVVVQTSRYALAKDITGSHAFLDQIQVANLPRLGDETLQAVQRLPGAAVNGFSSLGPIRGGVPNETAILLDGLRLYEPFHLKNYLSPVSLLDSRLIDGIDVYFGGFPARYGDRMSAIIDTHSVQPPTPRYYELGLTLFHASALAATSLDDDRARVLVSARRSNLGELAQLAENEIGKPQYSDGFARFDYRVSETTRVSVDALLSHDSVSAVRSSGTEVAEDESSNGYIWATLSHDWSEALATRAIVSWTSVTDERRGEVNDPGRRSGQVRDDRAFDVVGLRLDSDWRTASMTHRFGAEVRRLWAEYEYDADVRFDAGFPFPGSPPTGTVRNQELHPDGFESSAYWDARVEATASWAFEAGLRVDSQTYDASGDSAQWSPRVGVLYNAGPRTRLRASWGRFYQAQGINELQIEDGVDQFYPAQHANHTIFSVEHAFASNLDARLELYRKDYRRVNPRFENLFDSLVLLPELAFDRVLIAPSSARADGAEVWLNWQPTGAWSGWFSYTWSQVQDRIDGRDEYRSWDQRHAVSIGLAWSQGPWAVTIADSYHTGWPTTALTLDPAGGPPVVGPRNAVRYTDFNSLDLRVTRTFALPRGELDVFVEATNLTSHRNPCCTEYRAGTDAAGNPVLQANVDTWLPLVPSFGVLWRYGKE